MIFEDSDNTFYERETDEILIGLEDWKGLLAQRKKRAELRPNDVWAQITYAEALILNKKFNEAICFLTPIYKENYKDYIGVREIIDALIGLGKTENDFQWIRKPKVFRLDHKTLDFCIKYLLKKKTYYQFFLLYDDIWDHADYIAFDACELVEFLLNNSDLFAFRGNKNSIELLLKIKSSFTVEKWLLQNLN